MGELEGSLLFALGPPPGVIYCSSCPEVPRGGLSMKVISPSLENATSLKWQRGVGKVSGALKRETTHGTKHEYRSCLPPKRAPLIWEAEGLAFGQDPPLPLFPSLPLLTCALLTLSLELSLLDRRPSKNQYLLTGGFSKPAKRASRREASFIPSFLKKEHFQVYKVKVFDLFILL